MKKRGMEITARTDAAQTVNDRILAIQQRLLPEYGPNWHRHSMAGMKVEALARTIYYTDLYRKIIEVPGVICEFGVQWGATMAQLINLRSVFEPFNHSRMIYGFDTFEGFPAVTPEDGTETEVGDYASMPGHFETLKELLVLHEAAAPMSHIKKHALIKGDASETFPAWAQENAHAIIAMAIFDMDLYAPTRDILADIEPLLTKGSILVFDELNCAQFPGETKALRETLSTSGLRLRRTPMQPFCSWAVWGD